MSQETVLVIGATGNIGVSAVLAALKSGRHVLAIVRNQASADKLFQHVGTKEGITTVEASIVAEKGVQSVVDKVRAGSLPAFQHVYAAAGGHYAETKLTDASLDELRESMNINFESNFLAYHATIPYLIEQGNLKSTWTICTGAQGDLGLRSLPAMTQGALFSMLHAAEIELAKTNVRLNEIYTAARVEVDSVAEVNKTMKASDFARVYEALLSQPEVRNARVYVRLPEDLEKLRYRPRTEAIEKEREAILAQFRGTATGKPGGR